MNFSSNRWKTSQVSENALSDHKLIFNQFSVNSNAILEKKYIIKNQIEFQSKFVQFMQNSNYQINNYTMLNLRNKYQSRKIIIYNIPEDEKPIINDLLKVVTNPSLIHRILKHNRKKWIKLISKISKEYAEKTRSSKNEFAFQFWDSLKKVRKSSSKIFVNNKHIEKEYFDYVRKQSKIASQETLDYIKNEKITTDDYEIPQSINEMVTIEKVQNIIKFMKDKAVCNFDKIRFYKTDPNWKYPELINYQHFILSLTKLFRNWIYLCDPNTMEYIRKRSIIWIH